ncbi:cryptochrome/photolyase family protein [Flavobacteriaceae bacterium 14752]|uniref:cryptochrome/photolyase family protein n=1 Tax=Mesohalobacter salilacus TaxID=2491711 RepID=UPI000F63B679|nr:deoxyribodipyrimidine photo-lyase [Flavobacteriaceae bacterium 14752]
MMSKVNVFWFRRDLRLHDNVGLYQALKSDHPVLSIFIYDRDIIDELPKDDARLTFIFNALQKINETLKEEHNSSIAFYHGKPDEVFKQIIKEFDINAVYTNRDYEPYAKKRDSQIESILDQNDISFHTFKDLVVFEKSEVVKNDGEPYLVFTPYMKKWKKTFKDVDLPKYPSENHLDNLIKDKNLPHLTLEEMGFKPSSVKVPDYNLSKDLIENYEENRDKPSIDGTSRLSPYLRFGLVGYREVMSKALSAKNETFLNELIWREFYMMILFHYPQSVDHAFKKKYDRIQWRNDEEEFEKWRKGQTGYPIVDAGMRQLNETGWMHNRVRMIVGSFLCKHLLIDWRWGEAYFAEKLLDYEMSSNVGGWQWVAGSGVDAAPYFRIFNPYSQTDKFDKDKTYIKKWVPEFDTEDYPKPMVNHKEARERCLETYKSALN